MKTYTPPKLSPAKLAKVRASWFAEMLERRKAVAALSDTERAALERITDAWDWPQITVYGGPDANVYPPHEAYKLANQYRTNSWFMNPWLITEDGWLAYVKAFEALPPTWPDEKLSTGGCGEKWQLSTGRLNFDPGEARK
jgi:hypothetical protein